MSSNDARSYQSGDRASDLLEQAQPDTVDDDIAPLPEPRLPDLELPQSELDLTVTFESLLSEVTGKTAEPEETQKVQKRASNVLKLAQENAKLQEELRAMNERLEAAQRRQEELGRKLQSRPTS
ncbi:unnamed protein product [Somion occarium]|uniref:Uncharacterized protein n=1 Tax=Somion occarium TaxID=3059160 RepID=A0ABP1DD16_9APHY